MISPADNQTVMVVLAPARYDTCANQSDHPASAMKACTSRHLLHHRRRGALGDVIVSPLTYSCIRDEIDLSILDGEVTVLGPSGCGKTTVLPVGKGAVFAVDVSRPQFVDPASEKAAGQ